jgi:hypothetical protein
MSAEDAASGRTANPGSENDRDVDEQREDAEKRFAEGLVVRGEVVAEGTEPLPPGVTHEFAGGEQEGTPPRARRRRFSARG